MSTATTPSPDTEESVPISLKDVEHELARRLQAQQHAGDRPVVRACLSNLVIYCNRPELAAEINAEVPGILAHHPARVLLLIAQPGTEPGELITTVAVRPQVAGQRRGIFTEQITLRARGQAVEQLPYAVRTLVIGDLPLNLWWAVPEPPPLGGPMLEELGEHAQQIVYDSIGWLDPARGVVATSSWLAQLALGSRPGRWRVASDLNWRRLKYWRRLLGQALDPATAPGVIPSISEVHVEHGPHAVIQAWELAGWLGSRLGWLVQAGRVQPGVEITWRFRSPTGTPRVRVTRLPEGPTEIRRIRIACSLGGKPATLDVNVESEYRLSVQLVGVAGAEPRTVTVQPHRLGELVGQQMSDRDQDPVFLEAMGVGRALARSLLGP